MKFLSESYNLSNLDGIQDIHVNPTADDSPISSVECQPVSVKLETSVN
jgi:hypothetical protein